MVVSIGGRRTYLWRAVDSEGEVLDLLVQPRRDARAALKLMRKLLGKQGYAPGVIVTDKLRSYGAGRRALGLSATHVQRLRANNRPKTPTNRYHDENEMQEFVSPGSHSTSPPRMPRIHTPSTWSAT